MKKSFAGMLVVFALISGSVLGQTEVNYPSQESGHIVSKNQTNIGLPGLAVFAFMLGGASFFEDHITALKEGQNPDMGNDRIIFSAQFKNDEAFEEGIAAGGSVLAAFNKCKAAKSHYEDRNVYGAGACDRIKEYAPNHHIWGEMKRAAKWFVFVPVVGTVALIASCTGVCVYKRKKD